MATFDLKQSLERASERFGTESPGRSAPGRRRSDRGRFRLHPAVLGRLEELLQGRERPSVREIRERLGELCAANDLPPPARATIYQAMAQIPARSFAVAELPEAVRETLYNLPEDGRIPGHQLAFYCLNYGGSRAISFAAALPWLALYQAARMPGWRPRSRGLLEAILRVRGIRGPGTADSA